MYQSDYRPRLEQAIKKYRFKGTSLMRVKGQLIYAPSSRSIKTVKDLIDALEKRATTEKQLRDLFGIIYHLLEPPGCQKSHCKSYGGSFAYCNCAKGEVPGKCKEHREYLKRKREREEKAKTAGVEVTA